MDRRDFLKASGVAAAVVAVPALACQPAQQGLTLEALKAAVTSLNERGMGGPYWVMLHPSQLKDLTDIAARERWKEAWRQARKLRKADQLPAKIMIEYLPEPFEPGQYEGIRFVATGNGRGSITSWA